MVAEPKRRLAAHYRVQTRDSQHFLQETTMFSRSAFQVRQFPDFRKGGFQKFTPLQESARTGPGDQQIRWHQRETMGNEERAEKRERERAEMASQATQWWRGRLPSERRRRVDQADKCESSPTHHHKIGSGGATVERLIAKELYSLQ